MNTLADLFRSLDEQVTPEAKAEIKALDDASLWKMHLALNGLIRSLAFYRNESPVGTEYFGRLGLPDDASSVLGELYWRHLRSLPMTVETITTSLERHWGYMQPDELALVAADLAFKYEQLQNA